ncbi:MAG TPA: hypothetical protein VIK91_25390 [Nannocystis sp.]
MGDFAVIAEGFTDQLVIKNILLGFFADQDEEPVVNFEQPRLDETARKGGHNPAGWTLVLKYFEQGLFKQALQLNTYLVVHIDTDVSHEYGVPKPPEGQVAELVAGVVAVFRRLIGDEIWNAHHERFIFAIAVHSIECWLLPPLFEGQKAKQAKVAGCFEAVDQTLQNRRLGALRRKDGPEGKDPDGYKAASRIYLKRKELLRLADCNPSLGLFVRELERRDIKLPTEPA